MKSISIGDAITVTVTAIDMALTQSGNTIFINDEAMDRLIGVFNQARGTHYQNVPIQQPLPLQRQSPLPNQVVWVSTPGGTFERAMFISDEKPWFASWANLQPIRHVLAWAPVQSWEDEPGPGGESRWYKWEDLNG